MEKAAQGKVRQWFTSLSNRLNHPNSSSNPDLRPKQEGGALLELGVRSSETTSSVEPPRIDQYQFLESPPQSELVDLPTVEEIERRAKGDEGIPRRPISSQSLYSRNISNDTYIPGTTTNDARQPAVAELEQGETKGKAANDDGQARALNGVMRIASIGGALEGQISPRSRELSQHIGKSMQPTILADTVEQVKVIPTATGDGATETELAWPTTDGRRRTPAPALVIESKDLTPDTDEKSILDTPTWAYSAGTASLAPPVQQDPMGTPSSPGVRPPILEFPMDPPSAPHPQPIDIPSDAYDIKRPTCSLNIVCYRGGSRGCVLRQIRTVLASRFADQAVFQKTITTNPRLITNDEQFFEELQRLYSNEMSGFWRRWLCLKTLSGLRLLAYSPATRPVVVPLDDFVLQEMFYAYKHPDSVTSTTDWIKWVFRLREREKRHALEFVEGWNSTRIVIAGMLPWLISCLVGVIWTATGEDAQTAFTVASFILTSGTVILALLAVISGIESSGRSYFVVR